MPTLHFEIYRYQPEQSPNPFTERFTLTLDDIGQDQMLLSALERLKEQDPTLTFRSSCKEGVCGSDGMNVNGRNRLSCITRLQEVINEANGATEQHPIKIAPLPGLPVIRDLVVEMDGFFKHYQSVAPYLQPAPKDLSHEILQTPQQRAQLDGLYECILCACCTTSCPSFWWNPDQFHGPAALLAAQRFVIDSRDIQTKQRLQALDDATGTFRCRNIQNCTANCPKGLNPSGAIQQLKQEMTELALTGKVER